MAENRTFEFYAFISYKREDEYWAGWLQRQLETYRIPLVIRRQHQDVPEKIYPVFRDKTDLIGGKVLNQLHKELEDSRFLIVICSQNSAKSSWVNEEIRHFIRLGREDYIIPFVVGGEPNAADPKRECFPEALRADVQSELLGISVEELGKRKAFLRVEATLLSLKFDQLIMRDRKRQLKWRLLAAASAILAMAASAAGLWYELPHSAYYRDYLYKNEVPVGIGRLSGKERKSLYASYQIVTKKGKVVSLECQNSIGKPMISTYTANEEAPVTANFFYEEDQLSRVEYRDENGREVMVKDYTSNLKAVDFLQSGDSSQVMTLASNQTDLDDIYYSSGMNRYQNSPKSQITRHLNTYDENGYLIQELYMRDNLNTPARDANGICGKRYERDAEGKIVKIVYLDENGRPKSSRYGIAGVKYTYDAMGRQVTASYFDVEENPIPGENGYVTTSLVYDEIGNAVEWDYLDENGKLFNSKSEGAFSKLTYDSDGFTVSQRYFDESGEPIFEKLTGTHGTAAFYDENRNQNEICYYDADMQPMSNNWGYAKIRYKYDSKDRIVWYQVLDQEGAPVYENSTGVSGARYEYDEDGNLSLVTYLDENEQPVLSKFGYATERTKRDETGRIVKQSFFDEQGEPVRGKENYAVIQYAYDRNGNLLETLYLDESGNPCMCIDGSASVTCEYDEGGNRISEAYFDELGQPVIGKLGYHMMRMEYDATGNCAEEAYFDTQESPMRISSGYAAIRYAYDSYGNETERSYHDVDGELTPAFDGMPGAERLEYSYDGRGNCVRVTKISKSGMFPEPSSYTTLVHEYDKWDNLTAESYLDADGNSWSDEDGVALYSYSYDEQNRLVLMRMFDDAGHPVAASGYAARRDEYDGKNRIAARIYYGEKGVPVKKNILYTMRSIYDDRGNCTEIFYEDKDGRPTDIVTGYYKAKWVFDKVGNQLEEAYYDKAGDLCESSDGYAKVVFEYDSRGNIVEFRYYDKNGEPAMAGKGFFRAVIEYSPQGWRLSSIFYDDKGELIKEEACRVEYRYDACGREQQRILYDSSGSEIYRDYYMIRISGLVAGRQGEEAGLEKWDCLIQYNEWNLYDFENILDAGEALNRVLQSDQDKEKLLVIGRLAEGETMNFMEIRLEPGLLGVIFKEQQCNPEEYESFRGQYDYYLKAK
ncbi:TIR domain-containing protein [Clostridium sp. AM58-1XD]|uniref:TIR domain-containing protein n=1 Tax=Clostridium sp. AM58-1XD TaxID=2292307 RepID=UPI000E4B9472|nr:TIR domain-containing protein [Clostridium sp. AM58-1XD]RGY99836.1 TIR domain-containing protein [Clostridium sp. AM58-1XD]